MKKYFFVGLLLILLGGNLSNTFSLFGPGLEAPESIEPYLGGAFPEDPPVDEITYEEVFSNLTFNSPLTWAMPPGQDLVFIGQRDGIIYYFDKNLANPTKNLLIDLSNKVGVVGDGGFLGFAFHPQFGTTGKNYFYTWYATRNSAGEVPRPTQGQGCYDQEEDGGYLVLRRYTMEENSIAVVPNSELTMIQIRLYGSTHRGGGLTFGDDGFLYLTTGDQTAWSKAQDIVNNIDGGVLRIDVNKDPTKSHPPVRNMPDDHGFSDEITGNEYYIPNDNPFLSPDGSNFEEFYTLGHRAPHRMTKDQLTGKLYVGEIGGGRHEEINVIEKGKNYGWPVYEGDFKHTNCIQETYNNMPAEPPLAFFQRSEANAIIGGYVYRGMDIPLLYGKYICADYGTGEEIWSVDIQTGAYEQLTIFAPENVISFGQDHEGEIYILKLGNNVKLYKLSTPVASQDPPATLSATGAFSDLASLTPAPGIIPYDLIEPFWSDNAIKRRWMSIPNDGTHDTPGEQIPFSEEGDWDLPIGTVLIKHFDLPIDETDQEEIKRLETRFSIKANNGHFYFLTYKWRADNSDADLIQIGLDEDIQITTSSGTRTQTWHYPSRGECLACHSTATGGALGLKTRQLNKAITYPSTGITANQLITLSHIGIIDQSIDYEDTKSFLTLARKDDPLAPLEHRARSYLDVNCGYCHRPQTDNRASFDARITTPLEFSGLFSSQLNESIGLPEEWIIFPGDISKSVAYHRMNSIDPGIAMPPVGKNELDYDGTALVAEWIASLDDSYISCDPINLARGKSVTQSSTLTGTYNYEATNAIDGNTNGAESANSLAHTMVESMPWWEIDLGSIQDLNSVKIWNRTDACCLDQLSNFHVFVSDVPFTSTDIQMTQQQVGVKDIYFPGQADREIVFDIFRSGRYLRIQLEGTRALQMAEVEIFGCLSPLPFGKIGEVGLVNIDHNAFTVNLSHEYQNPVVIAGGPSYFGSNESVIRVSNVTTSSFDIQIDEWDCLDGGHLKEDVSYVVVEAGTYQLDNGKTLIAGKVTDGNTNWKTVNFPASLTENPVVMAQCMSFNKSNAVTVRIDHSQTDNTKIRFQLQGNEGAVLDPDDETVGWIAVEAGQWNSGNAFEMAKTAVTHNGSWEAINFGQTYTNNKPLFLAKISSYYEADPVALRYNASTLSNSSVNVFAEEEKCNDSEKNHANESVHYVVFNQAGLINGIPVKSANTDLGIFTAAMDIGNVGASGCALHFNDTYFLNGSGEGIGGGSDEFQLIYKNHQKDGEIIARIQSVENTDPAAQGGVMFRESSAADAKMAFIEQRPDNQVTFSWRTSLGGPLQSFNLQGGTTDPKYVRLTRLSDRFAAYYSTASKEGPWTQIGNEVEVEMADDILVGLALTSNSDGVLAEGFFNEVCVIETQGYQVTKMKIKIFLQGPWNGTEMNTNLATENVVPLNQPYGRSPWSYGGGECVDAMPTDCVDWVLVQIRSADDHTKILAQRACLLRKDGTLIDVNNSDAIDFGVTNLESCYISVHHRNHLGVMTGGTVDLRE